MAKTISDYQKDYANARKNNDAAGMAAANKGANDIRTANGQATVSAGQDIKNVSNKNTGGGGGGSKSTPKDPDYAAIATNANSTPEEREAALRDRAIKEDQMRAAGTWNNSWIPTAELRSQLNPRTFDDSASSAPSPKTYTSEYINDLIDQKYAQAQKDALAQSQFAVDQGTRDIRYQLNQQLPAYQTLRDQSAATTQTALDNMSLRAAMMGNRGGIGERQYGDIQSSGSERLLQINLEQKNLQAQAEKQIADLQAQGRFQDAQTVAQIAQSRIADLIAEAQNSRNIAIQQDQFDKNYGLNVANLTGYYGGGRTMAGQQFDFDKLTTEAGLTGTYNGQLTMQGKQLQQQLQDTKFDQAYKLISAGLSNTQIAANLGITPQEAINLRNSILAANAPKASSGGGGHSGGSSSGKSTSGVDLGSIYQAIKASGYTPEAWLSVNGAKYGITTATDVSNVAAGYYTYDFGGGGGTSGGGGTTTTNRPSGEAGRPTSNNSISNQNVAGSYIFIGGAKYTMQQVADLMKAGKVAYRTLSNGQTEYYFKHRGLEDAK